MSNHILKHKNKETNVISKNGMMVKEDMTDHMEFNDKALLDHKE
jgi:hypothetical protein